MDSYLLLLATLSNRRSLIGPPINLTSALRFASGARIPPPQWTAFAAAQLTRWYRLPEGEAAAPGLLAVPGADPEEYAPAGDALPAPPAPALGRPSALPPADGGLLAGIRRPRPRPEDAARAGRSANNGCTDSASSGRSAPDAGPSHPGDGPRPHCARRLPLPDGAAAPAPPYFRTTGANRNAAVGTPLRKLTRIDFPAELAQKHKKPFFWPDGVFVPQKRVLCLLEAYRGIDTVRVIRQLEWHLLALEHGLPSLRYGFQTANKVLLVFETEAALHAVLKRLLTRPGVEEFAPLVACSTLERLKKNFQDWWYVWGGEIKAGGFV